MRRKLITAFVALLGTAGLTVSLAGPASASEEIVYDRCTFRLTASNGDATTPSQLVYVDVKFNLLRGHAIAEDITISNYTGRSVTFVNDRWQDMNTGKMDRGASGQLANGAATTWHASSRFAPGPDGEGRRVNVNMAATTRPGLGGGCSIYI